MLRLTPDRLLKKPAGIVLAPVRVLRPEEEFVPASNTVGSPSRGERRNLINHFPWKTNHLRSWHGNSRSTSSVDNLVHKSLFKGKMARMTGLFIKLPIV